MAAYVIADVHVTDPEKYDAYKKMAPPTIARYGGRYIVRGGRCETLEGDWASERLVVLEFDSLEQARAWWSSPEYEPAKKLRQETASSSFVLVEGV